MGKKLKIAFDAKRLFHNREGLGSYARTLVADLKKYYPEHEYYLCTTSISEAYCDARFLDPKSYKILSPPPAANASLWRARGIVKTLKENSIDIYFGLSNELPVGIDKLPIRKIVTIHDQLYKTFPQQFSMVDRWIYARKFKNAAASADMILATSENTKSDIIKYQSVIPDRIKVVYQAAPSAFDSFPGGKMQGSYYLMVGSLNERKNQLAMIEAYRLLDASHRKPVYIVGRGESYKNQLIAKIRAYGLESYFIFKENLSTSELVGLYNGAIALVFPSKYEGFGIPVIEALRAGKPVITLRTSSLPELVSKYGIIIEYDRPELLNEAILQMNDEAFRKGLMAGVEEHLQKFASENVTYQVIQALLG